MPKRTSHPQLPVLEKRAADFAAQNVLVPFRPMMNRFLAENKVALSQAWVSRSVIKHHGRSFSQMQHEARLKFVTTHADKSNEWLAQKLGVSIKGVSRLTRKLKRSGVLNPSKRYAQTKRAVRERTPLAYHTSALASMRLLLWIPHKRGLTVREISGVLRIPAKTIQGSFLELKNLGKVKLLGNDQTGTYVPTQSGLTWLRQMEQLRRQRDSVLIKTASINSVILRKQRERQRLENVIDFLRSEGIDVNAGKLFAKAREVDAEIISLKRKQFERASRAEKS